MARQGYQSRGDALVNQLADGVSLDVIWDEITEATSLWNSHRSALASLLSFTTTNAADAVPQALEGNFLKKAPSTGYPGA
jgi:hypothetical protein